MTKEMYNLFKKENENFTRLEDFTKALMLISNCPKSTEMLLDDYKRIVLNIKSLQNDIESLTDFSNYDDFYDARREFYKIKESLTS